MDALKETRQTCCLTLYIEESDKIYLPDSSCLKSQEEYWFILEFPDVLKCHYYMFKQLYVSTIGTPMFSHLTVQETDRLHVPETRRTRPGNQSTRPSKEAD